MKYTLTYKEVNAIRESMKIHHRMSINFLMRKFKWSYQKAQYLLNHNFNFLLNEVPMSDIKVTNQYDRFKRLPGNREINKKNLENIIDSIRKQNNLHLHPIIVNEEMYIIDGQHRIAAAKGLQLPIYYIMSQGKEENVAYDHIISANVNQKRWALEDFFHLYATKDKNQNYIEFIDLMNVLGLRPKGVIGLVFGPQTGKLINIMKNGEMKMPEDKKKMDHICNSYLALREFVDARKIKPVSMFTTHHFTYAFRMLMMNESCHTPLFFNKLENRWFELRPQATAKDWFNLLISIYNWKNSQKIEEAA